jgi:CheY-like chemotaxis protein
MSDASFTVLVIEDDRQIRRVVQGYLEQAGMRVLAASDGESGLLLGIDGWEITRRLRQHSDPAVANVHILMLTARVEEADRVEGPSRLRVMMALQPTPSNARHFSIETPRCTVREKPNEEAACTSFGM